MVPALWTPRAIRTCIAPMGPAPNTTTKSPSSMPICSWALIAQANGSAADASSKPTPSGMWLSPSTLRTAAGTIMYSAKPPSYWYPMDVWFSQTAIQPLRHSWHAPHGTAAMTWTRSPTWKPPSASAPTSTTSPAISCPIVVTRVMFGWPLLRILTSVPQVEQFRTRIFTSSGPATGSGTSSSRTSPGA